VFEVTNPETDIATDNIIMAKVQGACDDRFAEVKKLLQSYIDSGEELGASICVNIDGKDIIDIWGGYADEARTRSWDRDTITCIWSSSKTVCALAALVCIDRGLLDPYEKVSKYWPEFAQNGKDNVEVRHVLSHASGLSGWQESITTEDMCDLEKSTKLLEEQAPWWEPGQGTGYHAFTMGHLVGELVRRVTGKPLKQFIEEELAQPLGADFQLGAKESDWPRITDVIPPPLPKPEDPIPEDFMNPNSIMFKTFAINPGLDANIANTPLWKNAAIPVGNGYSNARALVRLLSVLSLQNPAFLSKKTIEHVFTEQQHGTDRCIAAPIRLGLGFALPAPDSLMDNLPEGRIASWGGWGGSQVIADVDRKMTISYVMNKMENAGLGQTKEGEGPKGRAMGNDRTKKYVRAVYEALGVP
jgi:CubicO group peptidase (beta-lactamase class C family)